MFLTKYTKTNSIKTNVLPNISLEFFQGDTVCCI